MHYLSQHLYIFIKKPIFLCWNTLFDFWATIYYIFIIYLLFIYFFCDILFLVVYLDGTSMIESAFKTSIIYSYMHIMIF